MTHFGPRFLDALKLWSISGGCRHNSVGESLLVIRSRQERAIGIGLHSCPALFQEGTNVEINPHSLVGRVGFEPTRVSPVDFKSTASAIPPPTRTTCSLHSMSLAVRRQLFSNSMRHNCVLRDSIGWTHYLRIAVLTTDLLSDRVRNRPNCTSAIYGRHIRLHQTDAQQESDRDQSLNA